MHGGWSKWSGWTSCSQTCGTGSQERSRSCTNPEPKYGGRLCTGVKNNKRICRRQRCPGKKINVASLIGNTVLFFHERSYSWFRWDFFKTACSRNALTIRHDDRFDSQKAFLFCFMLSLICVFSLLFVLLVFCLFICFVCLFLNFFWPFLLVDIRSIGTNNVHVIIRCNNMSLSLTFYFHLLQLS